MSVTGRRGQIAPLGRHLIHAIAWRPSMAAALVAVAILGLPTLLDRQPNPEHTLRSVRLAALLLGASASVALADQMDWLQVPTPRWLRQWLRVIIAVVPCAGVWALLTVPALAALGTGHLRFVVGLTAEASVSALIALLGVAVAVRFRRGNVVALAGAAALLGFVCATLFLPDEWAAWPAAGAANWGRVHQWWWCALPVLTLGLVAANGDTLSRRYTYAVCKR